MHAKAHAVFTGIAFEFVKYFGLAAILFLL